MAKQQNRTVWRAAREDQGLTQDDIFYSWQTRDMPESIRDELSRSKAQRFENGAAVISPVAKAHYAAILGRPLASLDKQAADDYLRIVGSGPDLVAASSTCNSALVAA